MINHQDQTSPIGKLVYSLVMIALGVILLVAGVRLEGSFFAIFFPPHHNQIVQISEFLIGWAPGLIFIGIGTSALLQSIRSLANRS